MQLRLALAAIAFALLAPAWAAPGVPLSESTRQVNAIARAEAARGDSEAQAYLDSLAKGDLALTERGIRWMRAKAERGDRLFQFQIAQLSDKMGLFAQALPWYAKSAEQGYPPAQTQLGFFYLKGERLAKDTAAGRQWLEKAARGGDADGQALLGVEYLHGGNIAQDEAKGRQLLEQGAGNGSVLAMHALVALYQGGPGLPANPERERYWKQKLAVAAPGEQAPQRRGVPDVARNARALLDAADRGDRDAQATVGWNYVTGNNFPKDDREGVKYLARAAQQGHGEAQMHLGVLYSVGQGVPKDEKVALQWYRRAADQGNATAIGHVGNYHRTGRGGLEKNDVEAVRLFKVAADGGDALSQFRLGTMYELGRGGLRVDRAAAIQLYRRAAAQGDREAADRLKKLEKN